MTDRIIEEKGVVVRHGVVELLEQWLLAISGIVLILSGLFQMPLPRRYYITDISGMAWSGDFMLTLKIHYIASIVFIAVSLFHVVYHGMLRHNAMLPKKGDVKESIDVIKTFFGKGEEPPFHKFLPEQRIAYVGMAAIIALLIISSIVKTYKNIYDPQMAFAWVSWATWLHNIFAVLFILAFIASVRLDYAEKRHPLWIDEIRGVQAIMESPQERADVVVEVSDEGTPADETITGSEAIAPEEEREREK